MAMRPPRHQPTTRRDTRTSKDRGVLKTAAWLRCRKMYLRRNPLCNRCGEPASHVHHIVDRSERPDLTLSSDNLEPLCHSCHSKETRKRQVSGRRFF